MRQTILSLCGALNEDFDSLLFGRNLIRISGCGDVFRISATRLKTQDSSEVNRIYTDESVEHWHDAIKDTLSRYATLDDRCRDILIKYMIYTQQFESHDVDYGELYHRIYEVQ